MDITNRLAFSTLGCPAWDFDTIVRQAKSMGYAALEMRGIQQEIRNEKLPCFLPENESKTRKQLSEAGLRICSLGTSVAFDNPERKEDMREEGRNAIAICQRMGIPYFRVFGDSLPVPEGEAIRWEPIADGLEAIADEAAEKGVRALMEVHGYFNTAERLAPILKRLNGHEGFGLIWDIMHSYRATGNDYLPFYQLVKPFVHHVHVKDCLPWDGEKFPLVLTGEGDIAIAPVIETLEKGGYTGYYSFEWEKRWHPELPEPEVSFPQYVEYMRAL